jgi:hypothetical protein
MKRLVWILCGAAAALALPPGDRTVWNSATPGEGAKPVELVVSGKTLTYYALDGDGCSVALKGPTRLQISVRTHFDKDSPETLEVTLSVAMDGGEAQSRKLSSKRSASAFYAKASDGAGLGARATHEVEVPEGEHTFRVKADRRALGKFGRASKKAKSTRTDMTPGSFAKAVREIYQERERTWYFAEPEKPVAVEVTGPTTLDVYASLNFDSSMRKDTVWHVDVLVDGKASLEKEFKSEKSHVRSYPDEKDVVPGQQEKFTVAIPEGRHKLELRPRGSHRAAFRVFIPTKDLKNGGK